MSELRMSLLDVPLEVLWIIAKYLDPKSVCYFESVAHLTRDAFRADFWREMCSNALHNTLTEPQDFKQMYRFIFAMPSQLDTNRFIARNLSISEDGLTLTFSGLQSSDQVAFGNVPYNPKNKKVTRLITKLENDKLVQKLYCSSVMYYEVEILESTSWKSRYLDPCIAIGLGEGTFPFQDRQPGWISNSYGYHSDDGYSFFSGRNFRYGPKFGGGQTVGCGWDFEQKHIFYTLDGQILGIACTDVPSDNLYPLIGLDSDTPLRLNFGAMPFKYDIENHAIKERWGNAKLSSSIMSHTLGAYAFAFDGMNGDIEYDFYDTDETDDDDDTDDSGDDENGEATEDEEDEESDEEEEEAEDDQ